MGAYVPFGYDPTGGTTVTAYSWPEPDVDGPLMKPLAKLAALLALLPVFQTRCGLSGSDPLGVEKLLGGQYGVKKRIYYPDADPESDNVFPCAGLYFGDELSWEITAGGYRNEIWPAGGSIEMILVDEDKHPGDLETSTRDYAVYVGTLLDQLKDQAAVNDSLAIVGMKQKQKPMLCPVVEETQRGVGYWHSVWIVEWQ